MWLCKNCEKKWYYSIDKCIFCREKVKSHEPKKFKIKGISKVFVVSSEHKRVPYFNIILEDEEGNLHLKKTFREYKLGEEFELGMKQEGTIVALSRVGYSVIDATQRAINLIGGIDIKPNDKILIKPNLVIAKSPSTGIVTNPLVVEGIIRYLLEKGLPKENILILEGSLQNVDSKKAIQKSGFQDLCEKYQIKFKNLFDGEFIKKQIGEKDKEFSVQISKDLLESNIVINVPVVKTHFQTGVSLGIKNMKGVINHTSRKNMHRGHLEKQIAYLSQALPRYITIADGSIGLEGMGPGALGEPANFGLIIAGKDPVAVDTVICNLIKLKLPRHVQEAAELGVGEADLNKISIIGEEVEVVQRKFKPANERISPHPNIELIDGKPCSGCLNSVWSVLHSLKEISAEEISIAFGSQLSEDMIGYGKIIAIGDCAINSLKKIGYEVESLKGCPPIEEQQKEFLKKWSKFSNNS